MAGRPKGLPKSGGRQPGSPNRATKEIKDMIKGALEKKGGQKWLEKQMDENPTAFMTLMAKIIPADVNLGGQKDNPLMTATIDVSKLTDEQLKAIATIKVNE